jgi:hypothetical protein
MGPCFRHALANKSWIYDRHGDHFGDAYCSVTLIRVRMAENTDQPSAVPAVHSFILPLYLPRGFLHF